MLSDNIIMNGLDDLLKLNPRTWPLANYIGLYSNKIQQLMMQGDQDWPISQYDASKSSVTAYTTSQLHSSSLEITTLANSSLIDSDYRNLQQEIAILMNRKAMSNSETSLIFSKDPFLRIEGRNGDLQITTLMKDSRDVLENSLLQKQNQSLKTKVQELQAKLNHFSLYQLYKQKAEASEKNISMIQECLQAKERELSQVKEQLVRRSEQVDRLIRQLQMKNQQIEVFYNKNAIQYDELQHLKIELERYEDIVSTLNQNRIKQVQTIIKEVPVYIEKDIIVEVPVPIYINQKDQKISHLPLPNNIINSKSYEESIEIQQSQRNSDHFRKNTFGIVDNECKSFRYNEQEKRSINLHLSDDARLKRVKEIVEVPVYIEKQIIKQIEKQVIKEIIVQKEIIRYMLDESRKEDEPFNIKSSISYKNRYSNDEELCLDSPRCYQLLLQSHQNKRQGSQDQDEHNIKSEVDKQLQQIYNQQYVKIDDQHFQQISPQDFVHSKIDGKQERHQLELNSKQNLLLRGGNKSGQQISIEQSAPIEKIVYVQKEVFLPVQIPVQLHTETFEVVQKIVEVYKQIFVPIEVPVEIIVQVIVEKQIIVPIEVQVFVQKEVRVQVPVERIVEVIVQKKQYVPVKVLVPFEVCVQKIVQKQVIVPIQVPVEINIVNDLYNEVYVPVEVPIEILLQVQKEVVVYEQIVVEKKVIVEKIVVKQISMLREEQNNQSQVQFIQLPVQIYLEPQKNKAKQVINEVIFVQTPIILEQQVQVQKIVEKEVIVFVEVPTQVLLPEQIEVDAQIIQIPTVIMLKDQSTQVLNIVQIPTQIHLLRQQQKDKTNELLIMQIPTEIIFQQQIVIQKQVYKIVQIPLQVSYEQIQSYQIIEIPTEIKIIEQVTKIVQIPKQVIKEVYIKQYIPVQKIVIKEILVQKQVQKQVIKQLPVQIVKQITVQKQKIIEIVKEVPVQVEIEVIKEKIVEVQKQVIVEKIKEVEKPIFVEREKIVYRDIPREVIKTVQVVKYVDVEKIVEVEKPIYIEKIVEKEALKQLEIIKQIEVQKEVIKYITAEIPVQLFTEVETVKEETNIIQIPVLIYVKQDIEKKEEQIKIISQNRNIQEPQKMLIVKNSKDMENLQFIEIETVIYIEPDKRDHQIIEIPTQIYIQQQITHKQESNKQPRQQIGKKIQQQMNEAKQEDIGVIQIPVQINIQKVIHKQQLHILQVPTQIKVQIPIEVQKIVQRQVVIEKIVEVEKQKPIEVQIEKFDQIQPFWIEVPVQIFIGNQKNEVIQTIIQREKIVYVQKPIFVQVPIQINVQKIIQKIVQKPVEIIIQIPVEVQRKEPQDKVYRNIQVQKEQFQIDNQGIDYSDRQEEKIVYVDKIVEKQIVMEVPVEIERIVFIEIPQEIYLEKQVEKVIEIIVQKRIQITKQEKEKQINENIIQRYYEDMQMPEILPIEITVEKIIEIEKIVQVYIDRPIVEEKIVQVYIDRPIVEEKIVQVYIDRPIVEEKIVQVYIDRPIVEEKIVQVYIDRPIVEEKIVQVYIDRPIVEEKIVQVYIDRPIVEEKIVQVYIDRPIVEEKIVQVYIDRPIVEEKIVQVYIDRPIVEEKIVQVYIDRPIVEEKIVQVYIDRPIVEEKIVQVYIDRPIVEEKIVQVYIDRPIVEEKVPSLPQVIYLPYQTFVEKFITISVPVQKVILEQKIIQIQILKQIQVLRYVPQEVLVEKQIFIDRHFQTIKQIYIDRPVQIIKQVYIDRTIQIQKQNLIELELQAQDIKQVQVEKDRATPSQIAKLNDHLEKIQISEQHQNKVLLLSDRQEDTPEDERIVGQFPLVEAYEIRDNYEQRSSKIQEDIIQKYEQSYNRLQQQLKWTQENLVQAGEQRQNLVHQVQSLFIKLQQAHKTINSQREAKALQSNVQRQLQQLEKIIESEMVRRQNQEKRAKQLQNNLERMRLQLAQEKNVNNLLEYKIKSIERSKENQINDLYKQIEYKNEQIQDLQSSSHQLHEDFKYFKKFQEKTAVEKAALQQQIAELKHYIDQLNSAETYNKQELQYKYKTKAKQVDDLKQKLESVEKIYKNQIEELINKNYQNLNHKNQQISQMQQIIQELEKEIDKANAYIKNIERQSKSINKSKQYDEREKQIKKNSQEQKLIVQNRKLIEINESLNRQLKNLNEQMSILQKQASRIQLTPSNTITYSFQKDKDNVNISSKNVKSRIKIEQIGTVYDNDQDTYMRMNKLVNEYSNELQKKGKQIEKMKDLICSYENVIEQLQNSRIHPYQPRSQFGTSEGFYQSQKSQVHMQLETNVYVSNLLRKLALLEEQLRFQKGEKLKISVRTRQYQKLLEEYSYRQANQSYEDDSELLEKLVFELQREKTKNMQVNHENEILKNDIKKLRSELEILRNNSNIVRNNNSSRFSGVLEELDQEFEGEFANQETAIRQYKTFKVKYYKILEIITLIMKQISILELKVPKNCEDIVNNIKRFMKIIENNEKNSAISVPSQPKGRVNQSISNRADYTRKQEQQLFKQLRRIDASIENSQEDKSSKCKVQKQYNNRFTDISLQALIEKNYPKQVKYYIAIKLIEFAIELLQNNIVENLSPEKIFITHFNPKNLDNIKITLIKGQKSKDKIRLYQAPEVLVGQPQSAKSFCWSIGIMIDKLFHGRLYYQKFADILSHKDNYEFQDIESSDIGSIVSEMIIKNRDRRITLQEAHEVLLSSI